MADLIDTAITKGKALDWSAAEGWPMGYDAAKVQREAKAAMNTLAAAVDSAPPEARAALGLDLVLRLNAKPAFKASVPPKRRAGAHDAA